MRSLATFFIKSFTDFLEIVSNLTNDDNFESYSFFIGLFKQISLNSIECVCMLVNSILNVFEVCSQTVQVQINLHQLRQGLIARCFSHCFLRLSVEIIFLKLFIIFERTFSSCWSVAQTRFVLSFLICRDVLNTWFWQAHPSLGSIVDLIDVFIGLRFLFLTENTAIIISASSSRNLYSSSYWLRVNDAVCFLITFDIRSSWINLDIERIFKLLLINLSLMLKTCFDVLRSTLSKSSSLTSRSCSLLLLRRGCW